MVNERLMLRRASLALALVFTIVLAGCSKTSAAKYTRIATDAVESTEAIFSANGLPVVNLQKVVAAGRAAQRAFESGASNALDLLSAFISSYEDWIASDVDLIKDQRTRTIVLVALSVGNIALHALVDMLDQGTPATIRTAAMPSSNTLATLENFRAKPRWRCRSSISGRFEKMDYCKANPATSQVEHY